MDNDLDTLDVSPEEEGDVTSQENFRALRQAWNISTRDQLVCEHLHLVHSVARRFSGLGESLDDLIQEGTIGLLKAVDLFDPDRGVKFSTYACHLITSQIQHYLRDRGRLIRQPAWVQELNTKVARTTEQLFQELGRDPQLAEVAERLNLPESAVSHALASRELNSVVSLSAPVDGNDGDLSLLDKDKSLSEKLMTFNLPYEDRLVLEEAIGSLKTLEQSVVRLFFFEDLNQSEIARRLGISANYSSYLLRRATAKIKTILEQQQAVEDSALKEEPASPSSMIPTDIPTYDRHTNLYTSVYLRARVAEEIERGRRYPTNFALMILSIDQLPREAEQANQAIVPIAQFLRKSTRIVDLIAHLDGGKFALLLPHTGREARVLGQRLSTQIRNLPPPAGLSSPQLQLHFGFAVFPMEGTGVESLYKRAELALNAMVQSEANAV